MIPMLLKRQRKNVEHFQSKWRLVFGAARVAVHHFLIHFRFRFWRNDDGNSQTFPKNFERRIKLCHFIASEMEHLYIFVDQINTRINILPNMCRETAVVKCALLELKLTFRRIIAEKEGERERERAVFHTSTSPSLFIRYSPTLSTRCFGKKSLLFFCLWVLCNLYDPARSLDSAHIASENIAIYSTARRKRVSSGMRRILNAADNGKIHNNTQLFYSN